MNGGIPAGTLRIVLGPTASGKERLALDCAERIGGEIVSVDSMKVYRGLDIGTAKPSAEQRRRVPHHALDLVDPSEAFSAADYRSAAVDAIARIHARGRIAVLSGGTALYYKAVLEGLFDGPPADAAVRERWRALARTEGAGALHEHLRRKDPRAAAKIHPNDERRLVRALEVIELTHTKLSEQQREWQGFHDVAGDVPGVPEPEQRDKGRRYGFPVVMALLEWPRDVLRRRIAERVDRMMNAGLAEEARWVWERRETLAPGPLQAVGYKEFFPCFEGRATEAGAVAELVLRTGQLVKSQMTWFRKFPARRIPMDDSVTADDVLAAWEAAAGDPPASAVSTVSET